MAERRTLELNAEQRSELEQMRDHDPLPYLRERAAALLKIADGWSPHAVARGGLLKPRDPDSVYTWLKRYREGGIAELGIHAGRGRKPVFPPSLPDSDGSSRGDADAVAAVAAATGG